MYHHVTHGKLIIWISVVMSNPKNLKDAQVQKSMIFEIQALMAQIESLKLDIKLLSAEVRDLKEQLENISTSNQQQPTAPINEQHKQSTGSHRRSPKILDEMNVIAERPLDQGTIGNSEGETIEPQPKTDVPVPKVMKAEEKEAQLPQEAQPSQESTSQQKKAAKTKRKRKREPMSVDVPEHTGDSEYDNIDIPSSLIFTEQIKEKLKKMLDLADITEDEMGDIIELRLERTKHTISKPLLKSQENDFRDPVKILEDKLRILDGVRKDIEMIIHILDKPNATTTDILNILDELYALDEIIFKMNHRANTPTHQGPVVDIIKGTTTVLMDFLKKVIDQKSKPEVK